MGSNLTMILVGGGFVLLIALGIVMNVQQYQREKPARAAATAAIPLEVLRRRARRWRIAAGICLIVYGLLKIGANGVVAVNGIEGNLPIPGLVITNLQAFICEICLGATLLITGVLTLRRHVWAQCLSAAAVLLALVVSLMLSIIAARDAEMGLVLVLASISIPSIVTALVTVALNLHLMVTEKQQVDTSIAAIEALASSTQGAGTLPHDR